MNLHIELSGRIFGAEIIDDQLVHRAVGADCGAKVIAFEFVHRAVRADSWRRNYLLLMSLYIVF